MTATPKISDEMLDQMTAEQLSRARIALHWELEIAGKTYHVIGCPTRDLKRFQGKAEIVATYTELDGVCKAHARTRDDRININTLIELVHFREAAAKEGLSIMATEITPVFPGWEEVHAADPEQDR